VENRHGRSKNEEKNEVYHDNQNKNMKITDDLGNRMKEFYENRARMYLPRRTYAVIRIDGKAFHTYTKGLKRPFDDGLIEDMNLTAAYLCKNIQGAKCAYVQSDEISVLITDFDDVTTDAWYDNNIQKIVSVSASMATNKFNELRIKRALSSFENPFRTDDIIMGCFKKLAEFDARVFTIPARQEVINYFIWRQQDATRNSISSVAQSLYSPKELHGKKTDVMQDMIFEKGINWNEYDYRRKRGAIIKKVEYLKNGARRNKWEAVETPIFTQNKEFFDDILTVYLQ